MPYTFLVLKIQCYINFFLFARKLFLSKTSIKQLVQYFNLKRVKREIKVQPRLYLSLTPSLVCDQRQTKLNLGFI